MKREVRVLFRDSLGVAIKEDNICLAYVKTTFGGVQLAAHAIYPLDTGMSLKKRVRSAGEMINAFLKAHRIGSTDVYIGIPSNIALLKTLTFPLAVKENIRTTIAYELEKYIPFSAEHVHFDFQILSENRKQNELKLLVSVVNLSELNPLLELRQIIGNKIAGMDSNAAGVVNYLSLQPGAGDPSQFAFVHGAEGALEIGLVDNGVLTYATSRGAGNSKKDRGEPDFKRLAGILRAGGANGELSVGIGGSPRDVEAWQALLQGANIPFFRFPADQTQLPAPALAASFGLAMKGLKAVPMQMNLLPKKLRKRPGRMGVYLAMVLAVLTIISAGAWGTSKYLYHQAVIDKFDTEIEGLKAISARYDKLDAEVEQLTSRLKHLNTLRSSGMSASGLLNEMSRIIPKTAWITNFILLKDEIRISGYAATASELISILENSPHLKEVAFRSAITKGKNGKEKFEIVMEIE